MHLSEIPSSTLLLTKTLHNLWKGVKNLSHLLLRVDDQRPSLAAGDNRPVLERNSVCRQSFTRHFCVVPVVCQEIQGIHARCQRNLTLLDVYVSIMIAKSGCSSFSRSCVSFDKPSVNSKLIQVGGERVSFQHPHRIASALCSCRVVRGSGGSRVQQSIRVAPPKPLMYSARFARLASGTTATGIGRGHPRSHYRM